jgi:hypothetical protein
MTWILSDDDLAGFWEDSDWARGAYVGEPLTEEQIVSVEAELAVRLPDSYLELLSTQNGGVPRKRCFPTTEATSWADDHVAISGVFGLDRAKSSSLCGARGSAFMQAKWGYPDFGICICDCPSAGHDMIMLDYRQGGPQGEPQVVHIDQERNYEVTFLAADFAAFVRGLVSDSVFDVAGADREADLHKIESGDLSSRLVGVIVGAGEPGFAAILRNVCRKLTLEKGCFALHEDELSYLVYDILFQLVTAAERVRSRAAYLDLYPDLLAFGDGGFSTQGYAPGFVESWFDRRLAEGAIIRTMLGRLRFSREFAEALQRRVAAFR